MPDVRAPRQRHAGCWNCGGSLCDGRACVDELDRHYASREAQPVTTGECAVCGQPLPLGGVCRCEKTFTGEPAYATYGEEF